MRRLLALAAVLVLPPFAVQAKEDDFHGDMLFGKMGYWAASYESGLKSGGAGFGGAAHAEFMGTGLTSLFGNRAGIEGEVDFSLGSYPSTAAEFFGRTSPALFEGSLGFPYALVQAGGANTPLAVRFQLAPGLGISTQQAFAYLRARFTLQVAQFVSVDLSYRWTPGLASYLWDGDGTGLNTGILRLALGVGPADRKSEPLFILFGEVVQGEEEGPGPSPLDRVSSRTPFRNLLRVGVGMAF